MPRLSATTLRSSIRQSRGLRRILAKSFLAFDTPIWYHPRYHQNSDAGRQLSLPVRQQAGNQILRSDRAGSRAVGVFGESDFGLSSPGVGGGRRLLRRFPSADPVTVHRGRARVQSRADGIAPKMPLGGAALITMMESADFRDRKHAPRVRRLDRARLRRVLLLPQVRPALRIVVHETLQVTGQAPFAEHNYMVQAFAADGADDAFPISSLPRRTRCRQHLFDPHGLHLVHDFFPEDPVAIAEQMAGCGVSGERLRGVAARSTPRWDERLRQSGESGGGREPVPERHTAPGIGSSAP